MTTSYFANVEDGRVATVLSITQEEADALPGVWIRTWYQANGDPAKRYNYASVGHIYDAVADAFYPPNNRYPSWSLDANYQWQPPTPCPNEPGVAYQWIEANLAWVPFS